MEITYVNQKEITLRSMQSLCTIEFLNLCHQYVDLHGRTSVEHGRSTPKAIPVEFTHENRKKMI